MPSVRLVIELTDAGTLTISGEIPNLETAEAVLYRALAFTQRQLMTHAIKQALTAGVQIATAIPPIPPPNGGRP